MFKCWACSLYRRTQTDRQANQQSEVTKLKRTAVWKPAYTEVAAEGIRNFQTSLKVTGITCESTILLPRKILRQVDSFRFCFTGGTSLSEYSL